MVRGQSTMVRQFVTFVKISVLIEILIQNSVIYSLPVITPTFFFNFSWQFLRPIHSQLSSSQLPFTCCYQLQIDLSQ